MEYYLALRALHISCAIITGTGFLVRGIWMLSGSSLLSHRLTHTLPHVNDTLLLGAAIGMAMLAHLNPLAHTWLTAKLTALLVYIVLGSIALRHGNSRTVRATALFGALLTFCYIVAVALTRNPFPFVS